MSVLESPKIVSQPAEVSYSRLCLFQLTARRAGAFPAAIKPELANENPPPDLINRLIQPVEKSAVLYQMASITAVFEGLLKREKPNIKDDVKDKITKIKDDLLKMATRYQRTHMQLNLLKILSFRLTAHINQLLEKSDVKQLKMVVAKRQGLRPLDGLNSSTLVENLQTCALQVAFYIYGLENAVVCDEKNIQWPAVFDKTHFDEVLDTVFSHLSDPQTKQLIKNLQSDLELLHGLSLAPRTLVPIAISSCRDYQRKSTIAIQELEGMMLERLKFLVKMMKEMRADNFPLTLIKGKGTKVKKCQAKFKEVAVKFIQDYQPALQHMLQRMQSMYLKAHMAPTCSFKTHIQMCRELLIELKKPDTSGEKILAVYHQILNLIKEAQQLPLSKELSLLLINYYILPLHDTSIILSHYSSLLLTQNLAQFIQAYESYEKLIPVEQREMKTDLFRPFDLLTFHLLESLQVALKLTEDQEVIDQILNITNEIYFISRQACLWYQTSFPSITNDQLIVEKSLEDIINNLRQILTELQTQAPQPQNIIFQLKNVLELLECFSHFLHSSSAYPFLFAALGKISLQKDSYEHQLAAQIANVLYKRIQEIKDHYFVREISINEEPGATLLLLPSLVEDIRPSTSKETNEKPSLVAFSKEKEEEYYTALPSSMNLFAEKVGFYLHRHWEKIPSIQPSNLIENYPKLKRLFIPLERYQRNLFHWKLDLEDNEKLERVEDTLKIVHSAFFEPYQILTRYFSICTLSNDAPSLFSFFTIHPKLKQQIFEKKFRRETSSRTIEKEKKTLIQILHAHVTQIGQSLALPADASQVEALENMRDCHRQVIYHLNSIEDLWTLGKDGSLSFYQHKALLLHQAAAIEQTVKLAALARPKNEQKRLELVQQLKSSHSPSLFFMSFLPRQSIMKKAEWAQVSQTVCAVDGFLTVPARYAVGQHLWLELLTKWEESQDAQEKNIQEESQTLQGLEQDNLNVLATLFEDIKHSLSSPKISPVFSLQVQVGGIVEGLLDQGLLDSPHPLTYSPFKFNQLENCLNSFFALKHVQPLSSYETTTNLVRRHEQIQANLDIIAVNSEEVKALLNEADAVQWCSSYASTLLLRGAVCLEKSMQALLFWLPVPSDSDDDQHYLLARRAGSGGTTIPLWHTHSIQDSAIMVAKGLEKRGKGSQVERMRQIGQQFGWLDPFIKQLYRYPFSIKENASAAIPRLFHALAELRRLINQDSLLESSKWQLQEKLLADSTELLERFDGLIQEHLTAQVIVPVHEMLSVSLEILEILQVLSSG